MAQHQGETRPRQTAAQQTKQGQPVEKPPADNPPEARRFLKQENKSPDDFEDQPKSKQE